MRCGSARIINSRGAYVGSCGPAVGPVLAQGRLYLRRLSAGIISGNPPPTAGLVHDLLCPKGKSLCQHPNMYHHKDKPPKGGCGSFPENSAEIGSIRSVLGSSHYSLRSFFLLAGCCFTPRNYSTLPREFTI